MATKGIQNLHNALKEQGLQADITVDDMLYMIETDERFARAVHRGMAKNYNNIGDADSFYSKLGITYAKPKAVEETATINAEIQPTEAETPVVATPKVENPVAEIQPTAPVAEPKTPAQILAQTKEKTTSNNANSAPATDESMLAKEQEIMQAQAQAVAPQTAPQAEAQPVAQAENTQSVAEAQAEAQPMAQTSSIDRQFSTEADAPYDTTQAEQPTEKPEQAEQPQVAEETTEEQAQTEQPSARKVFLADGENIAQTEIVREDADNYYVLDDAGKEMPINKTYGNQFFDSYDQAKEFNNQFSLEAEGLAERILASANESKSANQAVNDIIINSSGYKQLQGNDFGEWAFGETQAYAADSDNASPMSVAVISEYIPLVAPVASTVKQLQGLAKHEDGGKVYQELFHAVKSVGETYALAKTDADYNKINQNLAKRVEGIRMTAYAEAVLDGENFAKAKEEIAKWTKADDPDKVDMPETNKALLIVDTMKRSLSWSAEHPELADYNPYKNWDRYINNPEAQNNVGYDIDNIEWALSNIEPTTLKQWLSQSGKHNESAWADASYKIFNARMGENAFGLQMNVGAYLNQEDAWMAGLLNNAGIKDIDHYIHNAWFDELYDAVKPQLLTVYKNEADAKQLVRNFVTGRQVSKVFNSEYDQDDYLNFLKEFGSNKGRYNMAMSKLDEPEEIERMFNEDQRSYDYAVSFYQAAKERNEKAKANLDQMQNGHDWLRLLGLAEPHMIAYRIGRNALDWLKGQDETSINEKVSDIITDYEENGKQKGLFGHVTYQSAGLWNYFNQQYNESANNYWVAKVETIEDTALPMVVDFAIGTKGLALLGKGAVKLAQTAKLANYYQQLKKGSRILRTASVLYAKNPAFRVAGKAFTHMGRASIAALAMPGTYMYDNSTKAVNINPETGEAQAVDVDPITFGEKYLEQAGAYLFFNELGAYSKGLVQGTMSASTKGLRKLLTHGSAERKALYQAGDLKTFAQEFKTAYGEAVKGIHKGGLQQTASLFGAYGAIPMVTHDLATSIIKGDEDMLKHMLTPDYYTDLAVTCLFMELGTFQLHGKAIKGIKTLAWNGSARADWSKIDATTRQRYEENLIDKSIEKQSEYISQEANRIRQIADENVRKQEAEVLSKAINYALVENARRGAEQIGIHTNMFSLSRLKAIDAIVEGTMTRYTANENAHIAELPVAKGWKKRTNEEVCVVTLADGQRAECVVVGREVRTDGQYNQNVVRIEMQAKSKKASKETKGKGKGKDADKILSIAVDPNSVEVPYVDGRKTFVIETTEKGAELKEAEVKSIDGENVTVIVDGKVHGIKRIDLYTDAYIALESAKALDAKIKADKAIVEMDSPKEIVAVTDADINAEPQIATATEARVEAPEVEASHIRIEDKLAPGLVRDAHTETLAEADLVDKVAKKLGLSVRFVDAVDGGVANAKIEGNRVEIERNNPNPIKFLLGHELLHKIRTTSPDAYDAFVESARKAIPEFNKRVQMTRTAYQKADMKISNENAREEVFADFAGEMARDGKLLEKFIGESSPTLWQVLRDYYRKVKDLFTGKEFSDYERAEQALSNALKMAEQKAMKTPTEMIEVANDIPADASAETQFSIKIAHTLNEKSMEYAKQKGVSEEFMDALRKAEADINQMAERISQDLGGDLDAKRRGKRMLPEEVNVQDGKPLKGYSTIFKNGSYGRTMENTLKCLRTLAYIDFVNDVKERIGRPLTSQESFLASQMLYDISVDPQCLYCYVSLDRKAYDEFLIRYLNQRDAVITAYDSLSAKDKKNPKIIDELYQDFLASRKDTKEMKRRFNMWIDARKAGLPLLTASDVATTTRRDNIRNNGDASLKAQLKDAEAYAQGASWAKKEDEYRAYTGEILRLPQSTVNTLNKEYGLRFYSFSEYSPAFIVENMQMIRDAAIRGLRGLAYTKETDFVKIFAPSQININVSVFGRRDANGNMVADTRQGADWAEAKALREKYPNVGAVFVATNDAAVEWALSQNWIDVVIPFHIVRTGADIANFYEWVNYSSEQADKDAKGRKADISPVEHLNSKERYMQLVKERNLVPRFAKWSEHPNYMKLVNETRRPYDQSPTLTPSFNLNEAITSWSKFNEKGGYYGGWYNVGEQGYRDAVSRVTEDIQEGRTAKDVDYGRQDVPADAWNTKRQTREQRIHHNAPLINAPEQSVKDIQAAEQNAELGLGTPTRYSLKREPNTGTITDTATATAESLGVKVAIINDATREFKGAFNPKTGEIEINTAFATSEADVQQTVVHEVIGHGGIQAIAGDKFAEWCQQAYDSMSPESRKQTSARHKGITDAKEIGAEYMADLAMGEVINPSLWQRMVGNIRLRLRQLGIDMNLTDADIRYMLYSAHKMADKGKLQDSINHATTLAQLKEKAEQSHDVQEDFLSRPLMQVDPRLAPLSRGKYGMTDMQVMTTREYTDILRQTRLAEANDKSFGSKFSTTFIDSTLPIAEFVKSVYELDSINDAYTHDAENNPHIGANTARSKAAYRVAKFGDNHRQGIARNMNEQYQALMKANSDWSYDYVEALRRLYCVAKTGLERNQKVQAREALKEKGKGHPRTDFAGITGAMKWLGIVMTDWKGKKLNSIDWELEAKLLGKRNADQLTTAQVKRILAQKGFPKIEDFVTWYESMVGDNTINDFWWRMSRASHEVLRNQLESGLLSTESYQRLRWGETFFDRLVREGLNPADIEGARYLTHPNELVDRGWISQDVADSFAPYYQYYLPLQGSVDIQQKNVINYDYRERRESKKAVHEIKGHKQMVLDPVYRFFENATKAIHNEEQNRWLRQLLNVVREHEASAKDDALAIATKTYVDANGKPFFRKDANGDYITDADGNYITTPTLAEIKSGQAIEVKRELDVFDNMKTQAELIDQHRVIVYEDGTPISMLFADKSIAQAVYDKPAVFRSKDPLKVGDFEVSLAAVGNGINKINRWQSMMFTSKNPMFMIPNIVRDAQGGLQYNLMQGGNQWQLYSAIIFNQKVRQDVWAEIKNRTNGYYSSKSQYGSYVQEFFENGGQTAFTEVASLDAIREDMRRTIKDFEDSAVLRRGETSSQAAMRIAKKGWRVYNEWIERQGMASELMARVATYIAARESNKSIERAIYEAKECSVNFDRKGKGNYRRWYGVFGTFLNAAFQACRREKTLWRTGGATKYLAYRIIKPIVARTLSAGMSYMYYAMDNETSDDEKSFYDWARMYFSQDTHVANANYLFPVLGNDRGSLSIPNAMDDIVWDKAVWLILKRACLGYNAEESVGDDIMEVLSQAVDMTGTNPVSRFVGTFTPAPAFKGEDFTLGDRVLYSAGANPTLAPFAEAYVNADYKGSRLYFEQRDQNDIKPDSSRDLNKYSWGHQIAVALNELSGGTDYDAGWIDLQGSTIQSIFSATGGVYDFVRRSIDMGKEIYHAANDVATTHYGEERVADLADILVAAPIVSRFAKQPISRYEQMAIMDHSRGIDDEVEQWSKKVADAFKEGDSNRAANILNDVVESYRSADYMLALGRQNATSTYYSARSAEIKAYIDNLASQSYYNTELDVSAQANIIIGRALLWAKCVGNGASGSALENIKADDSAGLLYSIYKYAIPERRKIIKALSTADDANKEQYLNALAKLEQTIVDKFNSVDEVDYLPERKTEEDYNQ